MTKTSDEASLKPCPFCGVTPEGVGIAAGFGSNNKKTYMVHCEACDVCRLQWVDTEAEAISIWNTRSHADSAEVLERVLELGTLEAALEYLEDTCDEGPSGYGWKSDKLHEVIGKISDAIQTIKERK